MMLFFNLGGGEIFVVFLFVLLFFGSKNIPSFARTLGKGIRQFKNAAGDLQKDMQDSLGDVKKIKDDINKHIPK